MEKRSSSCCCQSEEVESEKNEEKEVGKNDQCEVRADRKTRAERRERKL